MSETFVPWMCTWPSFWDISTHIETLEEVKFQLIWFLKTFQATLILLKVSPLCHIGIANFKMNFIWLTTFENSGCSYIPNSITNLVLEISWLNPSIWLYIFLWRSHITILGKQVFVHFLIYLVYQVDAQIFQTTNWRLETFHTLEHVQWQ